MPRRRAEACETLRRKLPKLIPRLAARAQWKTRFNQQTVNSSHLTIDTYVRRNVVPQVWFRFDHVKNFVFGS